MLSTAARLSHVAPCGSVARAFPCGRPRSLADFEWICEHWVDAEANHIEGLVARSHDVLVSSERLVPSLAAELKLKSQPRPFGDTSMAPDAGVLDDETMPATIRVGLPPGTSVLTIAALNQSAGGVMQTTLGYLKIIGEAESDKFADARASVLLPLFEDFDDEATWSPLLALLSNSTVSVDTVEAFLDCAYETALAATGSPEEAARRVWGILTAQNRLGVSPHHMVLAAGTPEMYLAFQRRAIDTISKLPHHPDGPSDGLFKLFLDHKALPAPTLPEMPGLWNLLHTGVTGRFGSVPNSPVQHQFTLDRHPQRGGAHSMVVLAMANKQQTGDAGCLHLLLAAMSSVIETHGVRGITAVTNAIYDTSAGRSPDGQVRSYAFRMARIEPPTRSRTGKVIDHKLATRGAWEVAYLQAMQTADPDSIVEIYRVMTQCLGGFDAMGVHRRAFVEAVCRADPEVLAAYFNVFVHVPGFGDEELTATVATTPPTPPPQPTETSTAAAGPPGLSTAALANSLEPGMGNAKRTWTFAGAPVNAARAPATSDQGRLGQLFRAGDSPAASVEKQVGLVFRTARTTLFAAILDSVAGGSVPIEAVPAMLTILLNHVRGELSSHVDGTEEIVATLLMTPIQDGTGCTAMMYFARMPGGGPSLVALAEHLEVLTDDQLEWLLMYENENGMSLFSTMGLENMKCEHVAAVLQAAARLCPEAVRKALLAPDSKGRLPFAPARRSDNGREVNRLFAQFRETADRDTEADD